MLTVFKGTTDLTLQLDNYLTPAVTLDLTVGETIDFGYYKPISDLYIEVQHEAHAEKTLTVEAFTGSWTSLSSVDRTGGLARSGFVRWKKDVGEKESTLHGKTLYWYRLRVDEELTSLRIAGINLVFSDDLDLRESYPDIGEYLPEGARSFIAYHQEARNYILTYLRNKGKAIRQAEKFKMLDQFDLHNLDEVRQASKYLVLANIFMNESDSVDDKWKQKADGFMRKYADAINLSFLSIDENDNGKQENSESTAVQYIRVMRL